MYSCILTCSYLQNHVIILQVMVQWVIEIIDHLQIKLDSSCAPADGSVLVSAITTLCIAYKTSTLSQLSEQNCVEVVNVVRESYRPYGRTCPAYYVLENCLSTPNFR